MNIASMLSVLVLLALWAVPARAQSGPAGNAHPQPEAHRHGPVNPFGDPPTVSGVDAAKKKAFAERVDLSSLGDLSVYHNGRIKILGTLAAETVSSITARKDFVDVVVEQGGSYDKVRYRKVKYDPLFTFLDMIIDPAFYQDKPLVGVPYHPLREEMLNNFWQGKAPADGRSIEATIETWMKLGRLTPAMIASQAGRLTPNDKDGRLSQNKSNAIRDLEESMFAFISAPGSLMMVPPVPGSQAPNSRDQTGEAWRHLSELDTNGPVASTVRSLGDAWRRGDAAAVNAAARELAQQLPTINPQVYPTARRSLESLYNRAGFFDWGMWLYCFSAMTLVLAFGTGRRWLSVTGTGLLLAAVAVHAVGFGLRCYIAERYSIQNQFESMTGVSLFAALVGLCLMVFKKQKIFAAAAAGVGFLVLIAATQTGIPGEVIAREAAILNTSVLLKYHVTTVLLSYGLIALGFIVSLFYLATHYATRSRAGAASVAVAGGGTVAVSAAALGDEPGAANVGFHKVLADLDRAQMTILQLAFWVLGVGILLGAWWADHSWGRWWGWDPKEMWALVTWIIYLIVVHVRVAAVREKALRTAWLSVAGFVAMLWCYFGVNLLLPGLHAYA